MRLLVADLGTVPYLEALALQRALARARIAGLLEDDLLLLLEHPPVVTYGRSSKDRHLVAAPEALQALGIELHEVERGGDITFHGPGQLVGYPIIDLKRHRKDLHWYLRQVEEAVIQGVGALGVQAVRSAGYTGVWTRGSKLASIGVHARDWVTWHGFALNVTTDLSYFDLMVPCGIAGVRMTSLAAELDHAIVGATLVAPLADAARRTVSEAFAACFGSSLVRCTGEDVARVAGHVLPV
ncbi:MAG: lipoyl(octanoyl) transferase LipB [Gemmatimonadaceae bacterium]|nr:lipoyl(octanoyl) transferase LipB [Gemmatimonadaceae bacterium]